MINRWIETAVRESLTYRRGVNLTGARQVGKTTLTGMLKLSKARRFSLDDDMLRMSAKDDPRSFVTHAPGETLVIDEIQKVSELLGAIKIVLDSDSAKGQYLLTGSANLRFAKAVSDSLAGRLGHIRLRSLSLGELRGNPPRFLATSFSRGWSSRYEDLNKRDVIRLAFEGGYPESREMPKVPRRRWFADYLEDILKKDVRDVTEIRKLEVLKDTAVWLLAHTAQFFAVDELAAKCGIAKVTADSYMDALEAMYLFDRVPAWHKTDYERIGKRAKWIASDPALVANTLSWNEEDVYVDGTKNGKLVETWVYHELAVEADVTGTYEITQYRDRDKHEIDFIVENEESEMLGIEVKAGSVTADDFKHLRWFSENLSKKRFTGIVLYSGQDVLRFGEGFYAVPLSALGD